MSQKTGCGVQPKHERIVELDAKRFGVTVRDADGALGFHELSRPVAKPPERLP